MKIKMWNRFSKEQKKQLLIIFMFRLGVLLFMILFSAVMIYGIGYKHFIISFALGALFLQFIYGVKDTLDNIKRKGDLNEKE